MRVVVTADTHLRRDWPNRRLPAPAETWLERADVILHAGDITQPEHLDQLARFAPVHAVLGNNDHELVGHLPETLELTLAGVRIGMIHDSGQARGRARRLHQRFPAADLVVFGHSHIPVDEAGVDGQRLFNPGSPTERRRMPHRTIGVLELADGRIVEARIEVVDDAGLDVPAGARRTAAMPDKRTITVVQAELESVRRHLHEAPPHHGSGTRDALHERLRRLERELARLHADARG